jgi:retron-type reverse transcriptase
MPYRICDKKNIVQYIVTLSDRSQKVSVNNSESRDRSVTSGIPQGSVLGPILFVIYINDMPECVNASTYLFADDTKIYKEISCEDDVRGLQADLDQLQKWSDTWLLKFHPNKCKVRSVSNKTKLENKSSYHLYNDEGEEPSRG